MILNVQQNFSAMNNILSYQAHDTMGMFFVEFIWTFFFLLNSIWYAYLLDLKCPY